ncbi:glycosyltransferase family 4 protein [Microvirga tunisiensis]|nr:glycosyltransferase family 4 protein [Microvirga tunisiensis]
MDRQPTNYRRQVPTRVVLHYWGTRGGGSLFTLFLAQHLKAAQQPIDVVLSLSDSNADIQLFRAEDINVITFDRPRLSTLLREMWALPFRLRAHADLLVSLKPDVVVFTMNSPFAWPFIYSLKRRGLKIIYVTHDAEPHPGDYAATWQRLTQDVLIRRADHIVALSGHVLKRVAEKYSTPKGRTSLIPLETIYPIKRTHLSSWRFSNEPTRLLFYGRLLPYKGLNLLSEALKPFKFQPGWQLTIAGSGPLEATIRRDFADWPQVNLELGWISNQRTNELFSSHHLLLCPYTEASQSGVIAEALSWALPSLVMPTGALPEQIGFGAAGLIARTADAHGLSQALQTVFDKPEDLVNLSHGAAKLLAERGANQGWIELVKEIGDV